MNYYLHHLGDYAKDTVGLSQGEHGAYRLLIDAAYSTEKAIPPDDVYGITKAFDRATRKNTDKVLSRYFEMREDGWHQKRIDEEIATYREKSSKASASASRRWNKPVDNSRNSMRTHNDGIYERIAEAERADCEFDAKAMLASNHKPLTTNPLSSASTVLKPPEPDSRTEALSLEEARLTPDTPAGHLATVCLANSIRATSFHPLIVEWARDGVTIERLKDAIATARIRKPAPQNIPLAYLATILGDTTRPVDYSWKRDDSKAAEVCVELGIPGPKVGEQHPEFHARIERALQDRARRNVA